MCVEFLVTRLVPGKADLELRLDRAKGIKDVFKNRHDFFAGICNDFSRRLLRLNFII